MTERDWSRAELLAYDVPAALADGLADPADPTRLRPALEGEAAAAAAEQALEEGVPTEFLGLMVTNANELSAAEVADDPEYLLLELADFPRTRATVAAGEAACDDDADVALLADFLGRLHQVVTLSRSAP